MSEAYYLRDVDQLTVEDIGELPDNVLAHVARCCCQALAERQHEEREIQLERDLAIWPELRKALIAAGRGGQDHRWYTKEPKLTVWSDVPVVPLENYYGKFPKSKRDARQIALIWGDCSKTRRRHPNGSIHWVTTAELWAWVAGGGPIVQRCLWVLGFLPGDAPPMGHRKPTPAHEILTGDPS